MKKLLPVALAAAGSAAVAGGALAAWGYSELTNFQLREVSLPGPKCTILHISDLHMLPGQRKKIDFVNSLAELNPDLVINTGDNLSDPKGLPDAIQALTPLLQFPGAFCFGTNDYFGPRLVNPFGYLLGRKRKVSEKENDWRSLRSVLVEHGWHDVNNARAAFKLGGINVSIGGVDDPHHDPDEYPGPPHEGSELKLALLHAPEPRVLEQFAADGYQLALSGHTHGGQICLPGGKTIVTNCGIDRERAKGLHRFGDMYMHVSEGLGTAKFAPVRLWCPPAATLIHMG